MAMNAKWASPVQHGVIDYVSELFDSYGVVSKKAHKTLTIEDAVDWGAEDSGGTLHFQQNDATLTAYTPADETCGVAMIRLPSKNGIKVYYAKDDKYNEGYYVDAVVIYGQDKQTMCLTYHVSSL